MIPNLVIRELFLRHYRPLCLYALHYLKDADAVEDVVQEVFTAYWQRLGDSAPEHPKSYLYSMVRNRCIDLLRRTGRDPEQVRAEDAADVIDENQEESRAELEARLWTAVEHLPAKRRELLLMCKRDGMSYEAIAEATKLSVNTVRNQISRALKTLRDRLNMDLSPRLDSFLLYF
jgi:RNA polymerase sigma-70 factor (ECF subfamily)